MYNKLVQALPKPFRLVGDARIDETSAHNAVREALVNCIVHQDLNAMGNIVITRDESKISFSNPGMMLVSKHLQKSDFAEDVYDARTCREGWQRCG